MLRKSTYQPLKDDGAEFKCVDCEQYFHAKQMWFVCLVNGDKQIICHDCIDDVWRKNYADYIPTPI